MKRYLIPALLCLTFALSSCVPADQSAAPEGDFGGQLSPEEIRGGVLTAEILWKFGRVGDLHLSPDAEEIVYNVTRYDAVTNQSITDIYKVGAEGGETIRLTDGAGKYHQPRWFPDGTRIGFLSSASGSMQIWEMEPDGSNPKQVSDYTGDVNSFEYAPDGSHLLFTMDVKLDTTPLEIHPDLPLAKARIIDDLMYRHWDQWHDYAYSHIFVTPYGGEPEEAVDIMPGERWDAPLSPFFDAAEMCWTPDSKQISYTCKKLKGRNYAVSTNADIYLYDLASGRTSNLTDGMPGYDKYPSWSADSRFMAWQSMETPGYEADKERLFVLDTETGERSNLSADFDQNVSNLVWNGDGSKLYFISGIHATYQLYEMDMATGTIRQITEGDHDYTAFAHSGDVMIGRKMSMGMATEIFRIDPESGKETQLTFTNQHIYDQIEFADIEKRWIPTTDGKEMLTWVIFPPDFDPAKKYPAILYCGGGPQSAVSQFFSYRWNFQMMAAHDYIIVAPNRRGLPTFGQAWNLQISGDYGGQNMLDYLSAIDAVRQEPYVDEARLGAVGASYGGYSTFYLAGMHEGRFRAFISHCGVYNFEGMYGATEETFFVNFDYEGPYWADPKPKSYSYSPHLYVQNWDTPIMIIAGEHDYRIPYSQSLEAFNAAQLRGVPSRLLYFPDETHWVLKPQNSILWQREFFKWLDRYLK